MKRIQVQMTMELENSITQLGSSEENLTSWIDQIEDKMSGLKDKIKKLEHTSK